MLQNYAEITKISGIKNLLKITDSIGASLANVFRHHNKKEMLVLKDIIINFYLESFFTVC